MIIFLYGPDTFRAREKLNSLKKRFISEVDKTGANVFILEGPEMTIADLHRASQTRSFLARKRMVIINNILSAKKSLQAETLDFLAQKMSDEQDEESVLIFRDEKADERGALYKYLAKTKYREDFQLLSGARLEAWIKARVASRRGKIENRAASYLASHSDGNLWILSGELDKLAAYKRGKIIDLQDAAEAGLGKSEENIFKLVDAVAEKNWRQALSLAEKMLDDGAEELQILAMISRQFRIITRAKDCLKEKSAADSRAAAVRLKAHPFVLKKAMAQAGKYSLAQLKRVFERLARADRELKSGGNERLILEKLIMEIASA